MVNNQKLNVLIVEDEQIVALDIRQQLASMGHNTLEILMSGEDCLKFLEGNVPDLILMDINLSGRLSGIQAAEQINMHYRIPIVFLTAYSDDQTLSEIKKTGHFGFVTKPFKQIDLKSEIELTLEHFHRLEQLQAEHTASTNMLRETEAFFRQVVNHVSDIIYRINLKGVFTYVNPSIVKLTGFSEKELLHMRFTSLIREDYRQKAYFFFKNQFEDRIDNSYFEFPMLTKAGNEIWIGQNIHLLHSNAFVVGFQVIARDITREKEFKEQLIIAKRNAEKTAEIKSQFLANMSHEIRTPLNGIIGVVNLLDKTDLTEKQRIYLHAINSSSNQLMGIINDVLDLSKIEAGKIEFENHTFDLHELVRSVISVFEAKSSEKGIGLSFYIHHDVPHFISGDAVRLNQILYNLMGNAVKFTDHGKVELSLSTLKVEGEQIRILFTITDTGIGMEQQVINRIFEAFTQAEENTTRKFGGTGLGLSIVKKLVELQNGSIEVTSKLNDGSTFAIELPFQTVAEGHLTVPTQNMEVDPELSGLRILLVEDNTINQLVTKDLLEEKGVHVIIAADGEIGLQRLQEQRFDVVLMDMQMPVLDGYSAMKIIRESHDPVLKDIPIVALTANAIASEIDKCFSFGADAYLSKPFKPFNLFQKIHNLLSLKRSDYQNHTANQTIDMVALGMFMNGKTELVLAALKELQKSFIDDTGALKTAFLDKDNVKTKAIAHRIKPNFLLLGLEEMGKLCMDVENEENTEILGMKTGAILRALPKIIDQIKESIVGIERSIQE
jgi:PAS domain S-box-containing protein